VRFQCFEDSSTENTGTSTDKPFVKLLNDNNISVTISTLGAAITEFSAPDKHGIFKNIALSLFPVSQYVNNTSYAGATLGPNAGRIRGGELSIDRKTYFLTRNEGVNQLHGGFDNFSFARWKISDISRDDNQAALTLEHTAADGLDGYPGERRVSVTYTLDNSNTLTITFQAETDKPTWINLSNHTYWNLSGDFAHSAAGQVLTIHAQSVLYNDARDLPEAFHPVAGTPFDFRTARSVRDQLNAYPDDAQLAQGRGYNNAFLLERDVQTDAGCPANGIRGNAAPQTVRPVAVLTDEGSGRRMTISTDYPSLVFYSGGFLGGSITLAGGIPGTPSCALALEAQEIPDALHLPDVPHPIARPGVLWQRTIRFAFDLAEEEAGGNTAK